MDKNERIEYAKNNGIASQGEYEKILDDCAKIRLRKVEEYGNSVYEMPPDFPFDLLDVYSNIRRKYFRLNKIIRTIIKNRMVVHKKYDSNYDCGEESSELLKEQFRDLLNYCAMGIQVLNKLRSEVEIDDDYGSGGEL